MFGSSWFLRNWFLESERPGNGSKKIQLLQLDSWFLRNPLASHAQLKPIFG
jgi:hypothetical protein